MSKNLFSRRTTRFIAALMITMLTLAAMPGLPVQARPLQVITTIDDDIGTNQNKAAGTTLTITTTSAVTAGDDIIVTFAMDDATGQVSVSDSVGNTYNSYADVTNNNDVRTIIFAAFHVTALPNGSTITITHPNVTARAATASNFRGLAPSGAFDRSATATGNNANPSSGATVPTTQADELLIGAIGTEGPSGDNAGTWQNTFTAGPRVGTTGNPAASNITISMGYRIVNATGAYTAAKNGITARNWAAAIATFRMDVTAPTVTINQAAAQPDPTSASPINFTVTFSERVTGFATGDISFAGSTASGTLVGAVTEIAPNDGTTYNVAVTGMTSSGTVVASIPAGVATDIGGNNNVASTSTDNTVTYNAPTPPTITSTPPGGGAVNNPYSHTYTATGTTPITFSLTAGNFPPGLSLTSAGLLSGTPTTAGTYTGTVTATNGIAPDATQNFSITINQANTTATIVSDLPDPSVVGQAVTVAFTVTGQFGNTPTAPTGNVTVSDGTDSCIGTVADGNCLLTFTSAGVKTLTATYSGDANFSGSASAGESHQVNQIDTTTAITSDAPDPSVVGQAITVTYTVTPSGPGTPTGNVTVSDGVDSCIGTVAAGNCTLTLTTAGNRTLTATYSGDANFSGSTSVGESHTVNQAGTITTITGDAPDPSVVGQAVTVNYSVTVTAPGSGTPTGNVTVSDGTDSCTGTVAAGSCSITFTSAGAKTLTATYAGDANFSGSTSAVEMHQVNPADTTTAITSDAPDPSLVGQAVIVNYTVTVTAPGSGTPTGNVTVSDGTDSCTGTVAAGNCSITFTSVGPKTLTATYTGDANFNGSVSASELHTVNQAGTTTAITSDAPDPSIVGQAITVAYTVTPGGAGTPTGNVTVSDGVDSCTDTVAAGSCDITLTTAGNRTLTATYTGDANFSGSVSAGEPHTVHSSPAFLSADHTTFTIGSASAFTILASGNPAPAISHTSGALPTGIVFTSGIGNATLSGIPAAGTANTYTLTFVAANGVSPDATQTFTLTITGGPVIVANGVNTTPDTGDGHLDEAETVTVGLTQILVTFNKDVYDPTPDPVPPDPDDVTNPANYLLVSDNGDGIQTYTCDLTAPNGGITGSDIPIPVDSVTYTNNAGLGPFRATLSINGGTALPNGTYRLIVCGSTSIVDLNGLPLAGNGTLEGTDFIRNFRVAIQGGGGGGGGGGAGSGAGGGGLAAGALIPVTGFTPGQVTDLSHLPVTAYHTTGGAMLEIPILKLKLPIVGIPFKDNTWDVNWLLNQAGWLEGSAFPGFDGNSVLTSHVTLPYGQAGPFANLHKLKTGDKIFIHAFGNLYIYEIKSVSKMSASDPSILKHEDKAWLTLVTCADYNETVATYLKRLVVKAVLVQTQTDLLWYGGR